MINRFSMKQSFFKNNTGINCFHINPYKVKRTYNTILEHNHSMPYTINFGSKQLKQSDTKPSESLIKKHKPKIPEKILREIEKYNYQRYAYNTKVSPCPCQE